MMKSLRKRHLQVWTAWALLLPAGIVWAWLVVPCQQPVKLLQSPVADLLPVITQTKEHDEYTVNIRSDRSHTKWQLEWKNKTALIYPSAVIYKLATATGDIAKGELIGRIESRGDYIFSLEKEPGANTTLNLVLYDFIHGKIIDTLNFQP